MKFHLVKVISINDDGRTLNIDKSKIKKSSCGYSKSMSGADHVDVLGVKSFLKSYKSHPQEACKKCLNKMRGLLEEGKVIRESNLRSITGGLNAR